MQKIGNVGQAIVRTILLLLLALFVAVLRPTMGDELKVPPKIVASVNVKAHYGPHHTPDESYSTLLVSWKTTNADTATILGRDDVLDVPEGSVELGMGDYIFIAEGSGGIAITAVGGFETSKPGTGFDGLIYDFHDEFDPRSFEKYSYKTKFELKRDITDARNEIVSHLQSLGYNATSSEGSPVPGGVFISTSNYNDSKFLDQSSDDRSKNGELRRQAAIVVMLRPAARGAGQRSSDLYVLGIVQRNRPRQDEKWTKDPDGFQLALPLCKVIADSIVGKVGQ
jgi:hypothetical protein